MAKKVFCIGNGESRQGFDLEKLRPHGKIYGCNAIYRVAEYLLKRSKRNK